MHAPLPCPRCGYPAPSLPCPHCANTSHEPSLAGPPPGRAGEVAAGLEAAVHGLRVLVAGPGLKRWLAPPLLLTLGICVGVHRAWVGPAVDWFFALAEVDAGELAWWERALAWVSDTWLFQALHGVAWWLAAAITVWLVFTLLFEVIASPFLEEVQARVEARWFGEDPRARVSRPVSLPARRCAGLLALGGSLGLALATGAWFLTEGWARLLVLPVAVAPLAALARREREFGTWLRWALGFELALIWTSLKVTALTVVVLVFFLWLHLVPLVGPVLYVALSGFCLAIGLLDIPFSRRQWSTRQRLRFGLRHAGAVAAYGSLGSLLVSVPLIGPMLAVPILSVGGLWLVVRLDKSRLRGPGADSPAPPVPGAMADPA